MTVSTAELIINPRTVNKEPAIQKNKNKIYSYFIHSPLLQLMSSYPGLLDFGNLIDALSVHIP